MKSKLSNNPGPLKLSPNNSPCSLTKRPFQPYDTINQGTPWQQLGFRCSFSQGSSSSPAERAMNRDAHRTPAQRFFNTSLVVVHLLRFPTGLSSPGAISISTGALLASALTSITSPVPPVKQPALSLSRPRGKVGSPGER